MEENKSIFETLSAIDVGDKIEHKNNLSYLSWAWAWAELKKRYPWSRFTVHETESGINYFTDGKTCWVKVTVEVSATQNDGPSYTMTLPVMDYRNAAIPIEKITSMDVNKSIMRCLTKCIALHGLGLYIYAGEDLPEGAESPKPEKPEAAQVIFICADCGERITPVSFNGEEFPVRRIDSISREKYGRPLCWACMKKAKEAKTDA